MRRLPRVPAWTPAQPVRRVQQLQVHHRRLPSLRGALRQPPEPSQPHEDSALGRAQGSDTKSKELELHRALTDAGVVFEYQVHIPFAQCGLASETKRAFLDFVVSKPWGAVVIECDEEAHRAYDPSCDPRRDFDVAAAVTLGSGHKLRFVRYNPDAFKVDGVTCRVSKPERVRRLLEVLGRPEPAAHLERLFLFYDHESGATLPEVAARWDVSAKAVSLLA